ncbi:MAG: hypothetical protein ACIALR_03810 [Blastopirellula sp. JB062]
MLRLPFETITDLTAGAEAVRARRYGVIEVRESKLAAIHFRPWPKLISKLEIATVGRYVHRSRVGDCCRLYYNAPWTAPGFLSLVYVISGAQTTWRTFRRSLDILDQIAELRQAAAIVTDVTNPQISARNLRRNGWRPHCEHLPGRHYIKRFYGEYGAVPPVETQPPSGSQVLASHKTTLSA